jgi:hypothetical protein
MARRSPIARPLCYRIFDWSGFYVGLNRGWAGTHTKWTWDTPIGLCGVAAGCTGITDT